MQRLLDETTLLAVAEFAEFPALARLCQTSKATMAALKGKVLHRRAVALMAPRIMEEFKQMNRVPFQMVVRDTETLRFNDLDDDQSGTVTMIWVSTTNGGKSVEFKSAYVAYDGGFSTVEASIEVVVTPSETPPFDSGTMRITRYLDDDDAATTTEEYMGGFDYTRVRHLCPVHCPTEVFGSGVPEP